MRIFIVVLGLIYCAGASMAASVLIGAPACSPVAPVTASADLGAIQKAGFESADPVISRNGAGHETQPVIFSQRAADCD